VKALCKKNTSLVIPPTTAAPTELIEMFIQHRKELKKPLTQTALELNVRKFEKMAKDGIDVIAAIEHSIASGYQGIFPAPKAKAPWVDARDVKRQQGEQLQGALKENGFNNFFDYLDFK
jgi:hypothetical protein